MQPNPTPPKIIASDPSVWLADDFPVTRAWVRPLPAESVEEIVASVADAVRRGKTFDEVGVIVFFLQIDTVVLKKSNRDKHLQNWLSRIPRAFDAD